MEVDLSAFDFEIGNDNAPAATSTVPVERPLSPSGEPLKCPPGLKLGSPLSILSASAVTEFDIETGPLPLDDVLALLPPFKDAEPYPEYKDPGPFDESSVKYGVMKDPAKKKEKLEDCRAKHKEMVAKSRQKWEDGKAEHAEKYQAGLLKHRDDFVNSAALRAETGQILAIGYTSELCYVIDGQNDGSNGDPIRTESEMLVDFWRHYNDVAQKGGKLVGHYCKKFDLPMIVRRSWINGVHVPDSVLKQNRYWAPCFVDLMELWACGDYQAHITLNRLARTLGVGSKEEGAGAKFAGLYETDRYAALQYLSDDLELTAGCAAKLGVV